MGCESNAHNTIWSTDANYRGKCLLAFILEINAIIYNRGSKPTYIRIGQYGMSLSDHRYINFNASLQLNISEHRRNYRITDWVSFVTELKRVLLSKQTRHINSPKELYSKADIVFNLLLHLHEKSCPSKEAKETKPSVVVTRYSWICEVSENSQE